MDGNYGNTLDLRLPRADTLFWMDHPRLRCIRRAMRRTLVHWGKVRSDLAPGCPEQFDPEFIRYIWRFKDIQARENALALGEFGSHLSAVMFRRDGDAAAFLASVPKRKQMLAS